jgi:hypothetical protein
MFQLRASVQDRGTFPLVPGLQVELVLSLC